MEIRGFIGNYIILNHQVCPGCYVEVFLTVGQVRKELYILPVKVGVGGIGGRGYVRFGINASPETAISCPETGGSLNAHIMFPGTIVIIEQPQGKGSSIIKQFLFVDLP